MGKKRQDADPAIRRAAKAFDKSGLTLEELGLRMGFPPGIARRAAWQLFNRIDDPKLSTLRKLADALGVDVKELI